LITYAGTRIYIYIFIYIYRELRSGDTLEAVINILPLEVGKVIIDGLYLEDDSKKEGERYTFMNIN
jgi:hypothetical protein